MRAIGAVLSLVILVCASFVAFGASLTIDADRMAVIDGKRTFIVGLYENPADDAVLKRAAESGFNLVQAQDNTESLDRLQAHGVWAWLNTGYRVDLGGDAADAEVGLIEVVDKFASHPALLVWEVPDEALWNCWYGAQCYRSDEEPVALRDRIAALDDKEKADRLAAQLADSARLRADGLYAESEQMADGIWVELGEQQPRPGYGLATAPERAAKLCAGMVAGHRKLRQLDPAHPVWMNHAPRNQIFQLAAFNEAADIVGCDIYPVPLSSRNGHSDLADRSLASVGAYTDRMQQAAPGKPVWMVLQGFGWDDLKQEAEVKPGLEKPRPVIGETRFMAYDAIVHGARGLLYWGTAYIEKDCELWEDLLRLASELKALQPVLSAPDSNLDLAVDHAETYGSLDRGVRVLAKDVDGKTWFVVVNEFTNPLNYTIKGLESLNGTNYGDTQSGVGAAVSDGRLNLNIRGHSAQVLAPE